MFKNYLKIALRNLRRQKVFSFINITGLAIGMACCILILLFVQYEFSYDRFHEKSDQIYRVVVKAVIGDTRIDQTYTPAILTETFLRDFPEVLHSIRIQNYSRGTIVRYEDRVFNEHRVAGADAEIFDLFTIPFIKGDPEIALTEPYTVVIAKGAARKYFDTGDPLNRVLTIDGEDFRISGVMEDIPGNSHFHFDFIISLNTYDGIKSTDWFANNFKTYIMLRKDCSQAEFNAKFPDLVKRYLFKNQDYGEWTAKGNFWEYYLQPLRDIHLHSELSGEFEPNGNATYVSIFSVIALFILLIACINYMNLSTARSINSAREVGMRKVVGSTRFQLIRRFLAESLFSSFIALIMALTIVELILPLFRNFVDKPLTIPYLESLLIIPGLIGFALFMGILAGSYPAFFLSSFKPIAVLKGKLQSGSKKNTWLRNGLVLLQFSISIILFAGTFIVYQQLQYLQNKKLGFDKEQVVVIKTLQSLEEQSVPFKDALRKNSAVLSVSGSHTLPGRYFNNIGFRPEGEEQGITLNLCCADYDFLETLKLEITKGRFFSRDFATDSLAMIINEKTANLLGWDDPLGKYFEGMGHKFNVIGVVKDFHYESLHQTIRPMALFMLPGVFNWRETYISVRVQTEDIAGMLNFLKNTWEIFAPDVPFEYSFLDDDYDHLYHNEQHTANVFIAFSCLAILIACLGLFGLASFAAEQRTKEIGIRKVLGASVSGIILLLSKEFTKLVLIANIIAWPVAWFAMNNWLQNFAYRTEISPWLFLASGVIALIIALLTVSFQAIKAAIANPVEALRYE